jgi:ribosomal protein S18 acetylase RimI-like enzyme
VNVRPATAEELPLVASILDEATAYVATKGYPQWPTPFPVEEIAPACAAQELFVVEEDAEVAAVFVLVWDDPRFWGERPPDAAYLHKLAVRRRFAHRGLGVAIVRWAEDQARAAGRPYLRLDCLRDNPWIRSFYEGLGFEPRGELELVGWTAALYEKPVA